MLATTKNYIRFLSCLLFSHLFQYSWCVFIIMFEYFLILLNSLFYIDTYTILTRKKRWTWYIENCVINKCRCHCRRYTRKLNDPISFNHEWYRTKMETIRYLTILKMVSNYEFTNKEFCFLKYSCISEIYWYTPNDLFQFQLE